VNHCKEESNVFDGSKWKGQEVSPKAGPSGEKSTSHGDQAKPKMAKSKKGKDKNGSNLI
jgi:hypothetical protein